MNAKVLLADMLKSMHTYDEVDITITDSGVRVTVKEDEKEGDK